MDSASTAHRDDNLERGLGVVQGTALNISNMVGIGPFVTIPLMLSTMGGPQAMLAWVLGALLTICDGLVWSELGAALPGSGGTYHYLREVFGTYRWGRLIPFLFIWQFLISGPMEIASGYLGGLNYVKYIFPGLEDLAIRWHIPGGLAVFAALACIALTPLLCARIRYIGNLGIILCVGTLITMLAVIVAGLANFHPSLLRTPPNAFHVDSRWIKTFSGAMLFAVYDYLGYYNICYLGSEVRNPTRTIPRAVLWSVIIIAVLYMTMNLCIIAVVPWQEAMNSTNIASLFMERLFGRSVAVVFTGLIIWTAVASVLALTLAYSRIPYAAARVGDFFHSFGKLDAREHYPKVSLFAVTAATAGFCFFSLDAVINAAVTGRILLQFVAQIVALHLLRKSRPDRPLPFRMFLYPIPALVALVGWLFIFVSSDSVLIYSALGIIVSGVIAFQIWQSVRQKLARPEDGAAND